MIAERLGADRAEVAVGFGDRLLAAFVGVGVAIARGAVGAHRQRLAACRGRARPRRRRPGAARVSAPTWLSYCSQIQRAAGEVGAGHQLEQVRADVGAFRHVAERLDLRPGLVLVAADVRAVVAAALRRRAGRAGCRTRPRRSHSSTMWPVSVTSPITAKSSSHLWKIASASPSRPGLSTISMRSWLSRQHHLVGRHARLRGTAPCSCRAGCRRRPCSPSRPTTR